MHATERPAFTKVELDYLAEEHNYRLLFGNPISLYTRSSTFGHTHQEAWFAAGNLFALDLWQGAPIRNASGELRTRTTERACFILQAGSVGDRLEKVPQVRPGAKILVRTQGQRRCKFFLEWIDALKNRCNPAQLDPEFFELKAIAVRCLIPERDAPGSIGFPADAATN